MDIHRASAESESTKSPTLPYLLQIDNSQTTRLHEPQDLYLLQVDDSQTSIICHPQDLPNHKTNPSENRQYFIPELPVKQDSLQLNKDQSESYNQLQNVNGLYQQTVKVDVIGKDSPVKEKQHINHSVVESLASHTSKYEIKISINYDNDTAIPEKLSTIQSPELAKPLDDVEKRKIHTEKQSDRIKLLQNYVHISDRKILPRAKAVLPSVLQIRARLGVLPRRSLGARTRFGPVEGVKHKISSPAEACKLVEKATTTKTPLFLFRDENNYFTHIDVTDQEKSNWIGLLPLGDQTTANLWLYEDNNKLYAITTNYVSCRKPLRLGYSRKYAEDYGLIGVPTKDLSDLNQTERWLCYVCKKEMDSAVLLQRHIDLYHKDKIATKRKYRCGQCTMTFARLFTLRRHKRQHCKKMPHKSGDSTTADVLPDTAALRINSTPNPEDNKIPSDESFQNYSNGLDFSTNLFDTDRISNLDMSATLRTDELNPYSLGYKDENLLANELCFINICSNGTETAQAFNERTTTKKKKVEPILITCLYCNQVLLQKKKRLHIRQCVARRLECECGKVFTNKKLLTKHMYTSHPVSFTVNAESETITLSDNQNASTTENSYKCDQCPTSFKRRGMLVNHLWRVHGKVSVNVPLQKRVLHYACPECPKIYRTVAKRDRHVSKHHPGAEAVLGRVIEGGVRTCEPAACPACPRQYHTRAKMLQHLRARHPQLAPPSGKKSSKPKSTNLNKEGLTTKQPVDFSSSHERVF